MIRPHFASLLLAPLMLGGAAVPAAPVARTPVEIVAAAPAGDWVEIASSDLLVIDLAPDRDGRPRRVVIQLLPAPFSQGWIGNIRKLAAAHWWDGTSVNRVQDNYVVQWGDASEKKPLPDRLAVVPQSAYDAVIGTRQLYHKLEGRRGAGGLYPVMNSDEYASSVGWIGGWPVGTEPSGKQHENNTVWPLHCYGMVGVGRNLPPDTGTGAELYTVIGQAPRQLDRNIALVGRIVSGIEHLSSLPRGTGALGFYETAAERVPIVSVRIAGDLPEAERPRFQYLSTDSVSFAHYADARANRRDPFYLKPAGGVDICNVPVPTRKRP